MNARVGCTPWEGIERIRYGQETRFTVSRYAAAHDEPSWREGILTSNRDCHDCSVGFNQLHHPGCDIEECPMCGAQALSCGCTWPGEEDEDEEDA